MSWKPLRGLGTVDVAKVLETKKTKTWRSLEKQPEEMQHLSSLLDCQFLRSFDGGGEDRRVDSWASQPAKP